MFAMMEKLEKLMKALQLKWYHLLLFLGVQVILMAWGIHSSVQNIQVVKTIETLKVISADEQQYARMLLDLGQPKSAIAVLENIEVEPELLEEIDLMQRSQQEAFSLIAALGQESLDHTHHHSWGWVKHEKVNANTHEFSNFLQLAWASVHMGFSGWEEISQLIKKFKYDAHDQALLENLDQLGKQYV
jgi:hypothetical protein